jgi:predicted GIY-YIG superfamily endonuclease
MGSGICWRITEAHVTQIYRAYGEQGQLLYLGVALVAFRRLSAHEAGSGWFKQVRRIEISEPYHTRADALAAEAAAIKSERPKFNRAHHPDRLKPAFGNLVIADPYEASRIRREVHR